MSAIGEVRELARQHVQEWFSPEAVPLILSDHDAMATLERNIAAERRSPLWKTAPRPTCKSGVPDALRWEVFERDDFTCQAPRCGSRRFLTADHIIPESRGGTTTLDNLQTLCRSCNSRKGSGELHGPPPSGGLRAH